LGPDVTWPQAVAPAALQAETKQALAQDPQSAVANKQVMPGKNN